MGHCLQQEEQQQQLTQNEASSTTKDNDISKQIKIIRNSDTSSKSPLSNLFDDNPNTFWYSIGIKDIFYILDIGDGGSISSLEITFSPVLYCSSMRFLIPINNDPYDDNTQNWKEIIKKSKMNNGYNKIEFDKNTKFRFIKLSFDKIRGTNISGGGQLGVEKLTIYGVCGKILSKQKTKIYLEQNVFNITPSIAAISHSESFSSSDNIQSIFNTELSYWCSSKVNKGDSVWIIFDCNHCKLKEIECIFHNKYVCKTISIETSDDNNKFELIAGLKEKSIKQLLFNDINHKRYIKIIFNDIPKFYLALNQIKFYGKDPNRDNKEDIEEEKEEKEEKKEEEEEEENKYEDITCSFSINIVKHIGCFDSVHFDIKNIFTYDNTYWCSPNRTEMKTKDKDIYIIFDVAECYIDRMEVMYAANKDVHSNTMRIYSSDNIDDDWTIIGEEKHLIHGELNKIKLSKDNKRYIKIQLDDLEDIRFGALNYLKFVGTEPIQKDDITSNIKALETSLSQTGTDVNVIFVKDSKFWASANAQQSFIVFDCNCFEIQRIKIKFALNESKCGVIKIAMSDVQNVYNFKDDLMEIECKNIIEDVALNDLYTKNGFHRYLMIRFDNNPSKVAIQQIRFYGLKSDNIPDEVLFELERHKSALLKLEIDDGEQFGDLPIKLVSNSAPFDNPQFKIEHLWSDESNCWVSEHKAKTVHFTFDIDEYLVKQIEITLNAQYPCKICIVFSGDTKNKKEMSEIYRKDKFGQDPEDITKPRIIELKEKHKQFIRIEFIEMTAEFFGVERFKFIGDGLDEETKELTLNDLYDGCDEDLIHKYLVQLQKEQQSEIARDAKIDNELIEKDGTENLGSKEWAQHKKKSLQVPVKYLYLISEGKSKLCKTKFEEEEHMKFARKQRELKQRAADKQFEAEVEGMKRLRVSKPKIEKTMKEYQKLTADGHQMRAQMKFMEYQQMMQQEQAAQQEMFKMMEDDNQHLIDLFTERNKRQVFDEWCDSIDNHPMVLSAKYNVEQYVDCNAWGIQKFDKDFSEKQHSERHEKLAKLLDECFEEKKRKIHKFHMFLLSTTYHYARKPGYDKTCWLLFDCGDEKEKEKKITHFELKFQSALQCKTVNIYSSSNEESGFELIHKKEIMGGGGQGMQQMMQMIMAAQMGSAAQGLGIDQNVKIELNGEHKRYIKMEFEDFLTQQYVGIERLKIYVPKNDQDFDEDFQLKIVAETTKFNSISGAVNIYKFESDYYWRTRTETDDVGHIIFETDNKKINKIEFNPENGYSFDTITIYQSDSFEANANWKTVFTKKDGINIDGLNVIEFSATSCAYIKIEITQNNDDLSYMGMKCIKFYGESKSHLMNIASQIKVIKDSGSFADPNIVIDNMYIADSSVWMNSNELKNPSMDIENKIRDIVCSTLNRLRGGGDITNEEKHFCKFLLCWLCQKHYKEILSTAKSVMLILRKSLDEEYKRLTDIKSRILFIKLLKKDAVKDDVVSNREILFNTYCDWYELRKALFWPNDLNKIAEEWIKAGLCDEMPLFEDIRRESFPLNDDEKEEVLSFTDCDELAMDFLNRIAAKLDPSFQNSMKIAFNKNREQMSLAVLQKTDIDLGVLSGPIKTKSRQAIKIKLDYNDSAHPRCMSVLDIVRCAIVCQDDEELVSLYNLLCSEYSGNILRVKNAFDPQIKNKTFGYRAVMMNIVYYDEDVLPKQYRIICEVQLLLSKYYQVRKKMHLGYTICRSEEGGIAEKKKPHYVLSEDCCKFGKLDV